MTAPRRSHKLDDRFMPLKIMHIDVWEIIYARVLGTRPQKTGKRRYTGSVPMSLDMMKINEVCKKDKDLRILLPFKEYKASKLLTTEAIINVSFTDLYSIKITMVNDLDVDPKIKLKDSELDSYYHEFADWYWLNKMNMGCEIEDKEYKDHLLELKEEFIKDKEIGTDKELMSETMSKTVRCFKGLMNYYLISLDIKDSYGNFIQNNTVRARVLLYREGFDIDAEGGTRHYVNYKRSASRAKTGDSVFIAERLYQPMMDWTWMGLSFPKGKKYDVTSIKAYESLVMSSIIGTVRIPRRSILMLDSVESDPVMGARKIVTEADDGTSIFNDEEYEQKCGKRFEHRNVIWDGQALVDESLFDEGHGMMLLRNSFFKACAFNTKIQQYFSDNGITTVTDMFGNKMDASKILMIVTIDSLKIDKFAGVFFPDAKGAKAQRRKMYRFWLKNIDEEFGIVKREERSHLGHGKYHEVSYQILNSLPLTLDDMMKVTEEDRRYIDLLKDPHDLSVFLHHIRNVDSSARKKFFIYNMVKYSPDFVKSDYFKKFRRQEIYEYKQRMKMGRLKIRADFYVLCSMPLEMLEYAATGDRSSIRPYLGKDEVYMRKEPSGKEIVIFRNPHMNAGSACVMKTAECEMYDRYLNFGRKGGGNIMVVSPWENNIMVKLGGADFDSDTVLYVRDETILDAAQRLSTIPWLHPGEDGAPVALADSSIKDETRYEYLNAEGVARIDSDIAKTGFGIGSISNRVQFLNSLLWDSYFKGKSDEYLEHIYDLILMLSVLNELEIDSAKHSIKIDIDGLNETIANDWFEGATFARNENNELIVPAFMKGIMKNKRTALRKEKYWECPIDHIGRILSETGRSAPTETIPDIEDLFDLETDERPDEKMLGRLREMIPVVLSELKEIDGDMDIEDTEKAEKRDRLIEELVYGASLKKMSVATMKCLFRYAFARYKTDARDGSYRKGGYRYPELAGDDVKYRYLGVLFALGEKIASVNSGNDPAISCIKGKSRGEVCELLYFPLAAPDSEDNVVLWGDVYIRVYH